MSKILLQIRAGFFGVLLLALAPVGGLAQSGPVPNSLGITYSSGNPLLAVPAGVGMAWGGGAFVDLNGNLNVPGCVGCTTGGANEPANSFLGGGTGGAAQPVFRTLVTGDLPATAITPGAYTCANVTFNQQGQATAASNNAGCGAGATSTNISATSYNFSNADCNQIDFFTASTPVTATIPTGLQANCIINGFQWGAGPVQIAQGSGFTLNSFQGGVGVNVFTQGIYAPFFIALAPGQTSGGVGGLITGQAFNVNNLCSNFVSSNTTIACTLTSGVQAGDAVLLFTTGYSSVALSSATNDKGDTCTVESATTWDGGSGKAGAFVCPNLTAGAQTFTVTYAGTGSMSLNAQEFGNVAASPYDISVGNPQTSPGGGTNAVTTTAMTTTTNGDIIVAGAYFDTGSKTANAGTGFTLVTSTTNPVEYQNQSAAGSVTSTFTATGTLPGHSVAIGVGLKHK